MSVSIYFTAFAFLLVLLPAIPNIWNGIRSIFVYLLYAEIINKKELSRTEFRLLMRYMHYKPFGLLRKFVIKRNYSNILEKFQRANFGDFSISCTKFSISLRNIILEKPDLFDKIQSMVIDKALAANFPELISHFAIATEDLDQSFRKLYLSISKYKGTEAKKNFEIRYKKRKEIEGLITLSP